MEKPKEEFMVLLEHLKTLFINSQSGTVLPAEDLIKIRDHIEVCDHLVDNTDQKYLLYATYICWKHCLQLWTLNPPKNERNISISELELKTGKGKGADPKQSTALTKIERKEVEFNANDKRFLRSLRISSDNDKKKDGQKDVE